MFVERVTLANVVAVMLMLGDAVGECAQFDGRVGKESVGGVEAIRLEVGTVSEDRLSVFFVYDVIPVACISALICPNFF